jgi:hypothetical protein
MSLLGLAKLNFLVSGSPCRMVQWHGEMEITGELKKQFTGCQLEWGEERSPVHNRGTYENEPKAENFFYMENLMK